MGFDLFRITASTDLLLIVPTDHIIRDKEPAICLDICNESNFPSLKSKAIMTLIEPPCITRLSTTPLLQVPIVTLCL